jgi:hypothetical protein
MPKAAGEGEKAPEVWSVATRRQTVGILRARLSVAWPRATQDTLLSAIRYSSVTQPSLALLTFLMYL